MTNNDLSAEGSCVIVLFTGFGSLAVTIFSLASGDLPVILSYFLAVFAMIALFACFHDESIQFIYSGIVALIFACVVIGYYSSLTLFVSALTLIGPCGIIGQAIGNKYRRNQKDNISKEIRALKSDNWRLNQKISAHNKELKIVSLLEKCGADPSEFVWNQQFSVIAKIKERISDNNKRISDLENRVRELDHTAQI